MQIIVNVDFLSNINIGKMLDHDVLDLLIDIRPWREKFPVLTQYRIEATSPSGVVYLPKIIVNKDNILWNITNNDTSEKGVIKFQIVATGEKDRRKTSYEGRLIVGSIMDCTDISTPPDSSKSWVDDVLNAAKNVEEAVEHVGRTVNEALIQAKESGEFDGADGYSPKVTATQTDTGATIEVTYLENGVEMTKGVVLYNGKQGAPDYVISEAEDALSRVMAAQGSRTFTLAVITDLHNNGGVSDANIMHACQGIEYIANRVKLDAFACLGDHTDSAGTTDWTECLADILACNNHKHAVKNVDMLEMVGNHDHKSKHSPMTFKTISAYNRDVVWGNMLGGYFYKDYSDYKLRIICLNTSETAWIGVSAEQYRWFIDSLDLSGKDDANEWQTLIMSHVPLDWSTFTVFTHVLKAYLDGTSWTDGTYSCDYTGKNQAVLIGCVHGHIHNLLVDKLYLGNSSASTEQIDLYRIAIPEVTESYGNHYSAPYVESTRYAKTNGTAKDTSFNVLCIDLDKHSIKAICYGAGYDRTIEYSDFDSENEGGGEITYTNLADTSEEAGWLNDKRLSTTSNDGTIKDSSSGGVITNYIQVYQNQILRAEGIDFVNTVGDVVPCVGRYSPKDTFVSLAYYDNLNGGTYDAETNTSMCNLATKVLDGEYIRISGTLVDGYTAEDVIITLDEEIPEDSTGSGGDNIPGYTNIIDTVGYTDDTRISTSTFGTTKAAEGYVTTGIGDLTGYEFPRVIRTSGVDFSAEQAAVTWYDASDTPTYGLLINALIANGASMYTLDADGNLTIKIYADKTDLEKYSKFQLCGYGKGADLIVTINEEIT